MEEHSLSSSGESSRTPISARTQSPVVGDRPPDVPFFSRLGVKHGIVLTSLVLLAMTVITAEQLHETMIEIERSAVDKGRGMADAIAPLVLKQLNDKEALRKYFNEVVTARDIDYVQVINANGSVEISSDPEPGSHKPENLGENWRSSLSDVDGSHAISQAWAKDEAGVDVYASLDKTRYLRLGVTFQDLVQKDMPRVMWRMVVFTLIVATVMVLGLIILLGYVLRPLRELHAGLRALASGDLNYEVPVYSRDEVGRVIQAFNATTERLRSAFEQIERLATRDPLTSLPNRRVFDERLAAEAARSRRYGHPFGLIVMDLDKFKDINDTHGHPMGDAVLRHVARVIEANIRETDVPARIGGEEFAVILPETSPHDVKAVAEKLRVAVSEIILKTDEPQPRRVHVTLSGGVACSQGFLVTSEHMMAAADAALYQSKGEGRNRTTMAPRVVGQTDLMKAVLEEEKKASDAKPGETKA